MKFNQVIWDALCYALRRGFMGGTTAALEEYAAGCDGRLRVTDNRNNNPGACGFYVYEFIPNPIPKY